MNNFERLPVVEGGLGADQIALASGEGQTSQSNGMAVGFAQVNGGGQILDDLVDGNDIISVGTFEHPDRGRTLASAFTGDAGNDTITLYGEASSTRGDGGLGEDTCGKQSTGAEFSECETVTP
ncbi:hypothetical protein IPZ68_10630 [Streptomyces arenae]|nr:hypothetical protein [Streptomyces arenae]